VDEPTVKVDEPTVKVDEPTVKVDEPTVKVDEPTVKVDEPKAKDTQKDAGEANGTQTSKEKTRGTAEAQLTDKGLNEPVPLTSKERADVEGWQAERNRYFKRWRETDLEGLSDDVRRLLGGRGADNAVRKSMTPDDLAAVIKERRGVKIVDNTGQPYDHVKEATGAMNSVRNRIKELQDHLRAVDQGSATVTGHERTLLQDKLGDLSRLLDHYESLIP
jgi:hypothetical protein